MECTCQVKVGYIETGPSVFMEQISPVLIPQLPSTLEDSG